MSKTKEAKAVKKAVAKLVKKEKQLLKAQKKKLKEDKEGAEEDCDIKKILSELNAKKKKHY